MTLHLKHKKMKYSYKNNLKGLLFTSPWIIGFLVFSLYPICISLYYSFTNFNIFMRPEFIGFDNYADLFTDDLFYKSLTNTVYMAIFGTGISIIFSLISAMLLNMKVKGQSIFRTIFFLPSIVPVVASTLMWTWIYNPQYGILNKIMSFFGLPELNWLSNPALTKPSLVLMGVWSTGTMIIIFLAALQNVPIQLYEAAELDGAGAFQKFLHITLPSISPIMLYQIILGLIGNFQYFTQAYIITGANGGLNVASGGPENSILFYALYLFQNAFVYLKMGKASAMAWILFIIAGIITYLLIKTSKTWVDYGQGGDKNE